MRVIGDLEERFRFSDTHNALVLSYELYEDGVQLWRYDRLMQGEVNLAVLKYYRNDAVYAVNQEKK